MPSELQRRHGTRALLSGAALLLVLSAGAAIVRGQADEGAIEGTVMDNAKAPISGARVVIVRRATNDEVVVSTSASGQYSVANLPAGAYRIAAEKDGFPRVEYDRVEIRAMATIRADFRLAPKPRH